MRRRIEAAPLAAMDMRAIAFVVLVCMCFVGMDAWRTWNAWRAQVAQMHVASSNLARAVAQQADDTIKEADTALVGLVERVEVDGDDPEALARLRRLMMVRVAELPQLNGLFVYDEKGRWLATSVASPPENLNNSDREYFIWHRMHPDQGPHVGLPIHSRSTGRWVVPVSRRINHRDGSFAGVALATIDLGFFESFYNGLDIGRNGAIALVLDNGVMLLRRPFADRFVGRNISQINLFRMYTAHGPAGTFSARSSQDGVLRIDTFEHLRHYPVFAAAALSTNEFLSGWWQDTLLHAFGTAILVVMVSIFGWRLIGQIRLRALAERELMRARDALASANVALGQLAMQDGLTGLANRRRFDVFLNEYFTDNERSRIPLAVVMLDVDHFKQFNDRYGHISGDDCLRAIGRAILERTSQLSEVLAARYGGEELAVLLPGCDAATAVAVAEDLCAEVRNLHIPHADSSTGEVTISAGACAASPKEVSGGAIGLVKLADRALYVAKMAGRNRVELDPSSTMAVSDWKDSQRRRCETDCAIGH